MFKLKKPVLTLSLLCALSAVPSAFAGGESSAGGGNAVVCFDDPSVVAQIVAGGGELEDRFIPRIRSIEMLDLVEARYRRGLTSQQSVRLIDIGRNETPQDYARGIASRFLIHVPQITGMILNGIDRFPENAIRYEPHGLVKIDDARMDGLIPEGCVLATMALQHSNSPSIAQMRIDERLYFHPLHSRLSQAVLMLHEYLYSDTRLMGHTDSRVVRALIGYLIAVSPPLSLTEFISAVNSWGLNYGMRIPSRFEVVLRTLYSQACRFTLEHRRLAPRALQRGLERQYSSRETLALFSENYVPPRLAQVWELYFFRTYFPIIRSEIEPQYRPELGVGRYCERNGIIFAQSAEEVGGLATYRVTVSDFPGAEIHAPPYSQEELMEVDALTYSFSGLHVESSTQARRRR